jgi:hypothetical protein
MTKSSSSIIHTMPRFIIIFPLAPPLYHLFLGCFDQLVCSPQSTMQLAQMHHFCVGMATGRVDRKPDPRKNVVMLNLTLQFEPVGEI